MLARVLPVVVVLGLMALPVRAGWFDNLLPTEVLPLAQGGQADEDAAPGVIPFTTFEAERQAVMDTLPCKWISMTGGEGDARYDFLCKGGTWATVSLMLDKAALSADGIGRVRLIFREWPETVHPGGGEAYVAQQFLQHVVAHFVPANVAKEVTEAFWGRRDRSFRVGSMVGIRYTYENAGQYAVHRMELVGRGRGLSQPKAEPVAVEHVAPQQEPKAAAKPSSVFDALPDFRTRMTSPSDALQPASAAELNTSPDPASLLKPVAPDPISSSLVPDSASMVDGREKAPTNFEVYNKADELTRDVQVKAIDNVRASSKVQAPVANAPDPTGEKGPTLKALPNPGTMVQESEALERPAGPEAWPEGEGLGVPQGTQVDPADPRFRPLRGLPQLKFIPKAVPLQRPDEVIQFEDEASGL